MSSLLKNTIRSATRGTRCKIVAAVPVAHQSIRTFTAPPAPAATTTTGNRGALAKDSRKRIAEYRLRKPTLEERTSRSDIYSSVPYTSITTEQVGQYVPFNVEDVPPNFRRAVEKEGKATDNYWMIRPETIETITYLEQFGNRITLPTPPQPGSPFPRNVRNLAFVHGLGGTGKTFTLAQTAAYFNAKKWFVISSSGTDVSRDLYGHIYQGTFEGREEIFEQNLKSRHLLQELALSRGEQLKSIPLTGSYDHFDWVKSEDPRFNAPEDNSNSDEFLPYPKNTELVRPTGKGTTLFDLVNVGAWRCDLSGAIYSYVMDELRKQDIVPVLFVFDEVNHFEQVSELYDPRDAFKRLPLQSLSIGDIFVKAINEPPVRGATIIASTTNLNALKVEEYVARSGKDVRMYAYTSQEMQCALEHYHMSKFLLAPLDLEILRRCEIITGGVPRDVYRFVCPQ